MIYLCKEEQFYFQTAIVKIGISQGSIFGSHLNYSTGLYINLGILQWQVIIHLGAEASESGGSYSDIEWQTGALSGVFSGNLEFGW